MKNNNLNVFCVTKADSMSGIKEKDDEDGGDGVRWKTPPAGQTGWTAYSGSSGRSMKLSAMHQASAVGVE